MIRNYLKVASKQIQVLLPIPNYIEAKTTCEKFFGKRYFSQFVREAVERYTEYFKSYEEALNTKRFYCDLDKKVYYSLINFCQDKEAQVGEIASLLLSEKLFEMGLIEDNYFIPEMSDLV